MRTKSISCPILLSLVLLSAARAAAPPNVVFLLADDLGETTDLAGTHRETVDKMKRQYEVWFADVAGRWNGKQTAPQPTKHDPEP